MVMGMYKSPIEIFYGKIETQLEGEILKAAHQCEILVDKEELLRALQYDRQQYKKGYADGKADAMAELVRCKDCKHYGDYGRVCDCSKYGGMSLPDEDDFCSYGERR